MESSDTFNCAIRIKEEPCDESPYENDQQVIDQTSSVGKIQNLKFLRENPTRVLQKCNEHHGHELDDVQIEFECKDEKLKVDLLAVTKVEDYSQNHRQDMNYINYRETLNKIKAETAEVVKKEISEEEATNFDCELSKRKQKRNTAKRSLFTGDSHKCDTCGKSFVHEKNLKRHIDSVHHKITYACEICEKTYKRKDYLKNHIDSVHKKMAPACNLCDKIFPRNYHLKRHIGSIIYQLFSTVAEAS
uniref:C2H2-type domain-containing protein n=1 Tax=Trichogramma kaykai TaxID=54128 RepID=A0ABD2WKP9_9HYME